MRWVNVIGHSDRVAAPDTREEEGEPAVESGAARAEWRLRRDIISLIAAAMASPVASLDLLDLFPIASTSESQPVTVEGRTLGVVGPFPVSSILHLALNHLRDSIDDDRGISTLSQRARGKQRDSSQDGNDSADGEFDEESFLDRLTREAARATATDGREYKSVLVLTGDRERLRTSLVDQFDDSLAGEHVGAHDLALLDKIDIRYCFATSSCYTREALPLTDGNCTGGGIECAMQLLADVRAPLVFSLGGLR